ncbi:hypothetical protein JWG45_15915, partial [Leptospira sp. 201903070]|nr:hypothetical protein [Leptospira ainlahdjerensis]
MNTQNQEDKIRTYYLLAIWSEPNSTNGVLNSLIPDEDYWIRKYKVIFPEFSKDGREIRFYEGCDYRIPLSKGKSKFEFQIFLRSPKQSGKLIKTIDLPPNHSIRLNVSPA